MCRPLHRGLSSPECFCLLLDTSLPNPSGPALKAAYTWPFRKSWSSLVGPFSEPVGILACAGCGNVCLVSEGNLYVTLRMFV